MQTVRLTTAQAIVRYLIAQRIEIDGEIMPLFGGCTRSSAMATSPVWGTPLRRSAMTCRRGGAKMSKAWPWRRWRSPRRPNDAGSWLPRLPIGPGATNMVTAAAVAMADRLPLLLLAGDTFQHRIGDPVLQQIEVFGEPSTTVNDCFRPVVRYWDRITSPQQVVQSLPHALNTMLDPGDCGPAFIGLPQDIQAAAYDYPVRFFEERVHEIRRPRPDRNELARAAEVLNRASQPLIVAGGGVHWSEAEATLATFAERHGIPVVETVAGRTCLPASHRLNAGPIGVTGCSSANALAAAADVVLAVGTSFRTSPRDPGRCSPMRQSRS